MKPVVSEMNTGAPNGQPDVNGAGVKLHPFVDTSLKWKPPSLVLYRASWRGTDSVDFDWSTAATKSQPCSGSRKSRRSPPCESASGVEAAPTSNVTRGPCCQVRPPSIVR